MPIEGYEGYKRRAFCNDVQCPVQMLMNKQGEIDELRAICKNHCLHTAHGFHKWVIDKGFEVVKPTKD